MNTYNHEQIPRLKEIIKFPIHIILLYIFIFQPPIISRTEYFIGELLIFIFFVTFKPHMVGEILKYFKWELKFLILILIYSMLRDLYSGSVVFVFKMLSFLFQSFIFSSLIVSLNYNKKESKYISPNLIAISFWVVILAGFLSIILLTNHNIYNYYDSIIIHNDNERVINSLVYRGFGVAENLTFTYSYLLGFFVGYIFYFMKSTYAYLLLIPLLLMSIVINARIGFIPIFVFLFLLLFKKDNFNNILRIVIFSIILIIIIPKMSFFKYFLINKDWISAFFIDFYNIFTNSAVSMRGESTINTIFTNFIILPKNISEWLFGTGRNLFLGQVEGNSDLGFITQLFYGGISFMILLFLFLFFIFRRLVSYYGAKYWFTIIFIVSLIILNIKGNIFTTTPGSRFFLLIYIYLIYSAKKYNSEITIESTI